MSDVEQLWDEVNALKGKLGDLTVAQAALRGESNTEHAKIRGDLTAMTARTSALEEARTVETTTILEAIRELRPDPAPAKRASNGSARSRDAGMVAAGGGLGAALVKALELFLQ